tara:strand:+ start:1196 stop:2365 length:1170 start_codon:yes stop_codon:yes gene_type:complete
MDRKQKTEKFALNSILFLIVFFLLAFTLSSYAQSENKVEKNYKVKESFKKFYKDIFKYSTIYGSYSESSPLFTPESYFVTQLGEVVDVSPETKNDFSVSLGIRKIARMDYENRENRFYDGSEQNASLQSNIGNVKGLEYLFQYTDGKQRGRDFKSERYLVRYIAKWWMIKTEIQKNGLINLDYKSADLRFKVPLFKKFSFSIGAAVRTHLPYGYNPIDDYLSENNWWELAYEYGFQDIGYSIDYDYDGEYDDFDWYWVNEQGDRVADTDLDFRRNDYTNIVNDYNRQELNSIGTLGTLSGVVGLDFYHYRDNFWLHGWTSVYPKHKHIYGDENFSYETFIGSDNWLDYNLGLISGWNVTKKLGVFVEYEKTKFWDKNLVYMKAGLNIKL